MRVVGRRAGALGGAVPLGLVCFLMLAGRTGTVSPSRSAAGSPRGGRKSATPSRGSDCLALDAPLLRSESLSPGGSSSPSSCGKRKRSPRVRGKGEHQSGGVLLSRPAAEPSSSSDSGRKERRGSGRKEKLPSALEQLSCEGLPATGACDGAVVDGSTVQILRRLGISSRSGGAADGGGLVLASEDGQHEAPAGWLRSPSVPRQPTLYTPVRKSPGKMRGAPLSLSPSQSSDSLLPLSVVEDGGLGVGGLLAHATPAEGRDAWQGPGDDMSDLAVGEGSAREAGLGSEAADRGRAVGKKLAGKASRAAEGGDAVGKSAKNADLPRKKCKAGKIAAAGAAHADPADAKDDSASRKNARAKKPHKRVSGTRLKGEESIGEGPAADSKAVLDGGEEWESIVSSAPAERAAGEGGVGGELCGASGAHLEGEAAAVPGAKGKKEPKAKKKGAKEGKEGKAKGPRKGSKAYKAAAELAVREAMIDPPGKPRHRCNSTCSAPPPTWARDVDLSVYGPDAPSFKLVVEGDPVPLKRPRHVLGGHTYDPNYRDKQTFLAGCKEQLPPKPFEGPVGMSMVFEMPRAKAHFHSSRSKWGLMKPGAAVYPDKIPDLDNLVKFVLDALNERVYVDDKQICQIHARKVYRTCQGPGRTHVEITQLA